METTAFDHEISEAFDQAAEISITVGLVDSLISISRALVGRDLTAPEVKDALDRLWTDEGHDTVMAAALGVATADGCYPFDEE